MGKSEYGDDGCSALVYGLSVDFFSHGMWDADTSVSPLILGLFPLNLQHTGMILEHLSDSLWTYRPQLRQFRHSIVLFMDMWDKPGMFRFLKLGEGLPIPKLCRLECQLDGIRAEHAEIITGMM